MTPDINALLRARPRNCQYGAPMGCSNRDDAEEIQRCYLQRIRFIDGDYGADGTYWGGGEPLWAAFTPDLSVLHYVRADTRADALVQLADEGFRHGLHKPTQR